MCRIAGIYNPKSESLERDILIMRDAMHRGGPDDAGVFVHPDFPLALGHRRLSFLDLTSAGHQPMQINDGKLQIVFNGEIYNFKEIRNELLQLGYTLRTQSDTEVILYSYLHWGKQCFERFNGMFALAIWDEKAQEIVLARDHAGMKPMYYYLNHETFIFASEIKAFTALYPHWEKEEIWKPLFLMFGHLPEPFTTLKGVKTLEKGSWFSVQLPNLQAKSALFYKDDFTTTVFDEERALELCRDILPAAVKRHLISDAPIGLFLSGGIDSSLLTLLAAPILKDQLQTLSIQFEEAEYSEEAYQNMVINITGSKHRAFRVSQQQFETALPDILLAMDQPSIDAINTYFISMYARGCGLKAVLSGLGADEIFGGYPSFNRFRNWKNLSHIPAFVTKRLGKMSNSKLSKLSYEQYHPMLSLYLMNRGLNTVEKSAQLTGVTKERIEDALGSVNIPKGIDYRSANSNVAMEMHLYMKNQLLKDADYMAMWHGLEIRVPFMDKQLVEAVNTISPAVKFSRKIPKSLLIESFATLLPAEIWHRKKQGFTFPFANWLKISHVLQPNGNSEKELFTQFLQNKVHWSRYWAIKVAAIGNFD